MQMRNFLLRGPAGTGKTMGAKAIAAGLGLPYMKYTCSANTEIFDFVGMIFPDSEDASTGNAQLDAERESWKYPIGVSDIVDADEWLSKNDISIGKESSNWHEQIDTYIDDLDGEDVLVSVDYHM